MVARNDISQSSPSSGKQAELGWRELAIQRPSLEGRRRRRVLGFIIVLFLFLFVFASVRLAASINASNDQLHIQIGNQQSITLDLRQSQPINPHLLGANVFPKFGTSSKDNAYGFMQYSSPVVTGLNSAHIKLLRFPGGTWGEDHYLSLDQLGAFSALLQQTNADGMIQARLSGPINGSFSELTDVNTRATTAARWVDFMNNPHSDQRIAAYAHAPFHPVKYWTIGNEPDTLTNPVTGKPYLVRDYVNDFIQFSLAMHHADPTIKVFGPEISEFYGPGAGPVDAQGQLWMEGFLKGVGAYEQVHHVTVLDGVSFHRFQFTNANQAPYMFLSSTGEWNYLLPALHQMIGQDLKHDVPIAITEINTNLAHQPAPARGLATLWWADTLATLMNQQVDYVAFSSASGLATPYPLFTADGQQATPLFRVMELFAQLQHNLIPLEVQRDPISMYATQDSTHQTVSLLFINKTSTSQLAQINTGHNPLSASPWSSLNVSLAGYSMVVITLHRDGNAEAYSFSVPASDDPNTAPVVHTICGNKTDTLAKTIPC